MILNGYNTMVGGLVKVPESLYVNLKSLVTTDRLTKIKSDLEIYGVDFINGNNLPEFIFPITLTDYSGKNVTILNQRIYINKAGKVTNQSEYLMMETAAILQHKIYNGETTILKSVRNYTVKAFAKSVSEALLRKVGYSVDTTTKKIELETILGHYFVCLTTNPEEDYTFISSNVLNNALNLPGNFTIPIIEQVGRISNIKELYTALKTYPSLYMLERLDMRGFIETINSTWIVISRFKEIMGASIEMPHLYTAICYASVMERVYNNTGIGRALDKKFNPNINKFIDIINTTIK